MEQSQILSGCFNCGVVAAIKRLQHHVHDAQLKAISIDKVSFSSWIMQDEIQTVCQGNFFFFPSCTLLLFFISLFFLGFCMIISRGWGSHTIGKSIVVWNA
jgi:hypothetical protein